MSDVNEVRKDNEDLNNALAYVSATTNGSSYSKKVC